MATPKYARQWQRQLTVPKEEFLATFYQVVIPQNRRLLRAGSMNRQYSDKYRNFEAEIKGNTFIVEKQPVSIEDNPRTFYMEGEFTADAVLDLRIKRRSYFNTYVSTFLTSLLLTIGYISLFNTVLPAVDWPPAVCYASEIIVLITSFFLIMRVRKWVERRMLNRLYFVLNSMISDIEAASSQLSSK